MIPTLPTVWRRKASASVPTASPASSPAMPGEHTVSAYGAYIDVESDVSERLLLGGALRYENYPDYGNTLDGKIAARLQVGDSVALRGAVSTGFRVPTAGQANLRNVTTEFQMGMLADIATLPPTNPVAQQKGAKALTPEESVNTTFGIVIDGGRLQCDPGLLQHHDRGSSLLPPAGSRCPLKTSARCWPPAFPTPPASHRCAFSPTSRPWKHPASIWWRAIRSLSAQAPPP